MRRGHTWIDCLSALALVMWFACSGKPTTPQPGEYKVVRKTISQRVLVSGQVAPIRRAPIQPAFNGYVQKLYVKLGQAVAEGAPLISISQSIKGSSEEVHPLRSPISGVVTQILKTEGQAVAPNRDDSTLMIVEDTSQMLLLCNVPELEIAKLKLDQAAEVRIQAASEKSLTGRIESLSLSAVDKKEYSRNSGTSEFAVRILIEKPLSTIHGGMTGIAEIVTSERPNVLTVPHEFIRREADHFEVSPVGQKPVTVELGIRAELESEILSGVTEGTTLQMFNLIGGEKSP